MNVEFKIMESVTVLHVCDNRSCTLSIRVCTDSQVQNALREGMASCLCFETQLKTDGSVVILRKFSMFMKNIQKELKIKISKNINWKSLQNAHLYF